MFALVFILLSILPIHLPSSVEFKLGSIFVLQLI